MIRFSQSHNACLCIPLLVWVVLAKSPSRAAESQTLGFNRDVRQLLSDNCFACHGPDANTREADLRLDVEEEAKHDLGGYAAIVSGNPEKSEVVARIEETDPELRMPPASSGKSLTPDEKAILIRWIQEGAAYQKHWAFEPVQRPEIPGPNRTAERKSRHPIDYFVRRKLKTSSLTPSPPASPTTLFRRVTLDLTGLPPSLEQIDAFRENLNNRGIDRAYEIAVEALLTSPRYGEHMAWTWLEAARYADTDGYQNDGPRDMWRWRDWVIDAFNRNLPFDQFTIEQLAGDLLDSPTHEQLVATGFNRNHRYNSEEGIPIDEFLLENAVDRVDTTSTVWLGLTMGCARCHDHKFDPLSQREYYQLIDYFNDVDESGRAIKIGNSEPWIRSPTDAQRELLVALDENLAKAEKALKSAEDEIQESQETWEASFLETPRSTRPIVIASGLETRWTFEPETETEDFQQAPPKSALVPGVFGKALAVNPDKQVSLQPVHGLIGNGRFSVSFWMKPESVDQGTVLSNESRKTTRPGILVEFDQGHLRWNIIGRWIGGVQAIQTKAVLPAGEWVHVTLTNDGTQRTAGMSLYLDGELQETEDVFNTNSNASGPKQETPMNVGWGHHTSAWSGAIDELRFYSSRTLPAREIEILAQPLSIEQVVHVRQRSALQKRLLRQAYLESTDAPRHRALHDKLHAAISRKIAYEDTLPTTMVMNDSPEGRPSFVRQRGVYDQLGEPVQPGVPEALPDLPEDLPNNRLAFAKWLVSNENPLTARVTVNRIWQSFFGHGLVETAGDFGSQGSPPTHPGLLDCLAAEFIDSGWDLKNLVRFIVTSKTYRQSSETKPTHLELDPDNVLLSRAPAIRLPGNVLRDQALAFSGLLVEDLGGPSVKPYQPKGLWREASNFTYKMDHGSSLYRRSLYTYWKRTLAPPTMAVLDTGDREYCTVKPKRTNTPLQALALLNDVTFVEAARKLAERTLHQRPTGDESGIDFAFRTVTARHPTEQELTILKTALSDYQNEFQSDPQRATQLLRMGEAPVDAKLDPVDLAAMTALANVLLNLDEVTTRE